MRILLLDDSVDEARLLRALATEGLGLRGLHQKRIANSLEYERDGATGDGFVPSFLRYRPDGKIELEAIA